MTGTMEPYPDRESVLAAKARAITIEDPRRNIQRPKLTPEVSSHFPPDWGSRAEDMPDMCHDWCVKTGDDATYYPFKWRAGTARYRCRNGRSWTCWWGHSCSGNDHGVSGKPAPEYAK